MTTTGSNVHLRVNTDSLEYLRSLPRDQEAMMLNLIRFRQMAEYAPHDPEYCAPPVSGKTGYRRYIAEFQGMMNVPTGKLIWSGDPKQLLIGPTDEYWGLAFVRSYDRLGAFLDMVDSDEYRKVGRHRTAAVADSRLLMTETARFFSTGSDN